MLGGDFAEFVGAVIGDGNIYDKGPSYVEICGDPSLDKKYIESMSETLEKRLGIKNSVKVRSNGIRMRINNKALVGYLKEIGIPSGSKKGAAARIPEMFLDDWSLASRCIRGVFDTDGCIFHYKRSIYKEPYMRICLHMKNRGLLEQVREVLLSRGINAKINSNGYNLSINGPCEVNKFLKNVGFSNERHLKRITPQ